MATPHYLNRQGPASRTSCREKERTRQAKAPHYHINRYLLTALHHAADAPAYIISHLLALSLAQAEDYLGTRAHLLEKHAMFSMPLLSFRRHLDRLLRQCNLLEFSSDVTFCAHTLAPARLPTTCLTASHTAPLTAPSTPGVAAQAGFLRHLQACPPLVGFVHRWAWLNKIRTAGRMNGSQTRGANIGCLGTPLLGGHTVAAHGRHASVELPHPSMAITCHRTARLGLLGRFCQALTIGTWTPVAAAAAASHLPHSPQQTTCTWEDTHLPGDRNCRLNALPNMP